METRGDGEVPHTQKKWISTPVPAPKRSTLGVVAALDSVEGLCSGIESNISTDKDTIRCTLRFQVQCKQNDELRKEMRERRKSTAN